MLLPRKFTISLLNDIHTQYVQSGQGQYLNIKTNSTRKCEMI